MNLIFLLTSKNGRIYPSLVVRKNRSRTRVERRRSAPSTQVAQPDPPATLQEWMERTRTNGRKLLEMLKANGFVLSEGHLSNILKGSRRCSLRTALELHEVTGVPIKAIAQWPVRENRTSQPAA
jgi:hypothetical protein